VGVIEPERQTVGIGEQSGVPPEESVPERSVPQADDAAPSSSLDEAEAPFA
jgi:hypothetical protein